MEQALDMKVSREIVDWMSVMVGVIGFVGNFASIYILSLPSVGRWWSIVMKMATMIMMRVTAK